MKWETIGPVLRTGVPLRRAIRIALVADTVSIVTMEVVDNAFIVLVPGALAAGLGDDFEIRIYDITGRLVKIINQASPSGPRWDGVDDLGNLVESGVYIYQFKADVGGTMKLISGTIAVAK